MKKNLIAGALLVITLFTLTSFAQSGHRAKHNMILFGESEIFASHVVYKHPHNYQIVLSLRLEDQVKSIYLQERRLHPKHQFIFLLDETNLKEIGSVNSISGTLLRENSLGDRAVLAEGVQINRSAFSVLFFNELPLSLE